MASTNLSKIVRGNSNFKPLITSKNTTEIVNSYVEKLYKQIPNEFKNDLMNRQQGIPKTENRFTFRKTVPEKFIIPIINKKPVSKLRSNGYRSPAMTAKNSFITDPRKLLKTPNFKIYARRRYASSVSTTKSSFIRNKPNNHNEEYRKRIYTPAQGIQFQTFRGADPHATKVYYDNSVVSKYMAPTRRFNETNNQSKTAEVSNTICNDLMFIDAVLKKRIRIGKDKTTAVESVEVTKQKLLDLSFKGWYHPSIDHYKKLTANLGVKGPRSSLTCMKQKICKLNDANSGRTPKKSKTNLQLLDSCEYRGFNAPPLAATKKEIQKKHQTSCGGNNATFKGLKTKDQPAKDRSEHKSYNPREALDFVCLTRAERRKRISNQREGKS